MPAFKDFPDSFYRVVTKGLYVRDGKLLMSKDIVRERPPYNQAIWELPGGGLDFGETFAEGVRREIKEEMGLTVTSVASQPTYQWTIRRDNARDMEWFYICLLAFIIDLKDLEITPTDECAEIKFFSQDEIKHLPDLSMQLNPLRSLFNPADFA